MKKNVFVVLFLWIMFTGQVLATTPQFGFRTINGEGSLKFDVAPASNIKAGLLLINYDGERYVELLSLIDETYDMGDDYKQIPMDWFKFYESPVTVMPGEQNVKDLYIMVPEDAEMGKYNSRAVLKLIDYENHVKKEEGVIFTTAVAMNIILNVDPESEKVMDFTEKNLNELSDLSSGDLDKGGSLSAGYKQYLSYLLLFLIFGSVVGLIILRLKKRKN